MNIVEKTKLKFKEVKSENGKYITNFKEGDDIKTYSASTILICPISADLTEYREIDEEQHQKYLEAKEKAFKEEMEEKEKNIKL